MRKEGKRSPGRGEGEREERHGVEEGQHETETVSFCRFSKLIGFLGQEVSMAASGESKVPVVLSLPVYIAPRIMMSCFVVFFFLAQQTDQTAAQGQV